MTILLLDIPGLSLAHLGCYGNDWVATPNLDRLASESVVFDNHLAGCPGDFHTGRIHAAQAGNWFLENQVLDDFYHVASEDASSSLAERFRKVLHGIMDTLQDKPHREKQLVWAEFPSLAPPWNLPIDMLNAYFEEEIGPDETVDDVQGTLEPWPDPPAKLPSGDEHFDRLHFTYAAVVTYVDAQLGWLVEKLSRNGLLEPSLLVITSSRALPLGEHGWVGHQRAWQHEENVHLPLLMRLPQAEEAGLRIAALTQTIDIVPTLIDYLGLPAPSLSGQSLQPLIRHEVTEVHQHICSGEHIYDSEEWALRTLAWAYLLPLAVPEGDPQRRPQLYVKPDDRWEVNDIAGHHPELVEELDKTLRAFITSGKPLGTPSTA